VARPRRAFAGSQAGSTPDEVDGWFTPSGSACADTGRAECAAEQRPRALEIFVVTGVGQLRPRRAALAVRP
jgi:hypothetical protein